jgi:hypothetical protein
VSLAKAQKDLLAEEQALVEAEAEAQVEEQE